MVRPTAGLLLGFTLDDPCTLPYLSLHTHPQTRTRAKPEHKAASLPSAVGPRTARLLNLVSHGGST
jgi:hypothetical protein